MNEERMCVNCIHCEETSFGLRVCGLYLNFTSGRNSCREFVSYPEIIAL
jgi:hypothetical protein